MACLGSHCAGLDTSVDIWSPWLVLFVLLLPCLRLSRVHVRERECMRVCVCFVEGRVASRARSTTKW